MLCWDMFKHSLAASISSEPALWQIFLSTIYSVLPKGMGSIPVTIFLMETKMKMLMCPDFGTS